MPITQVFFVAQRYSYSPWRAYSNSIVFCSIFFGSSKDTLCESGFEDTLCEVGFEKSQIFQIPILQLLLYCMIHTLLYLKLCHTKCANFQFLTIHFSSMLLNAFPLYCIFQKKLLVKSIHLCVESTMQAKHLCVESTMQAKSWHLSLDWKLIIKNTNKRIQHHICTYFQKAFIIRLIIPIHSTHHFTYRYIVFMFVKGMYAMLLQY